MIRDMSIAAKFKQTAQQHQEKTALAYLADNGYQEINYGRLDEYRLKLANILLSYGCREEDKIAIMLPNSPEWIIADLAAATVGLVVVPIHTSYNAEFITKIIEHSGAAYLIIDQEIYKKFSDDLRSLSLRWIMMVGAENPGSRGLVKIIAWPDLDQDYPSKEINIQRDKEAVHTIIYTSGTTGDPKGVMLSHHNLIANVESALRAIEILPSDRFFSFLPLSHALERTAGYYVPMFSGASIYFARSTKTIIEDIKLAQPTVLSSVPRIFEKLYGKIFDQIESGPKWKKELFFKALQLSALQRKVKLGLFSGGKRWLLDRLILRKIRAILGGHLRLVISGGASLNDKIIRFFDDIGLKILEGYGMTEASPIISVNRINNYRFGTVGLALDCNELKISEDKEILVRGFNVTKGYYKNEALTREALDSEGWLHTGDLGFVDKEGFISIIGRAKDVIVLSTGKNIFPEPIENLLNESRYISQSMVYGDNDKHLSALIVPNFEQLKIWCQKHNISYDLEHPKVMNFYRDKIDEKIGHLSAVEKIVNFKLLKEEFSQEKGMLTPTLKLRRGRILRDLVK